MCWAQSDLKILLKRLSPVKLRIYPSQIAKVLYHGFSWPLDMYIHHTKNPKKKREGKTVFLGVKGQGHAKILISQKI